MAQIQFTGNVGKDAELRHTQNGNAMLTFSVAESKSRRLQDGNWEELNNQWFNVTLFGPAAKALQQHVLKGARVQVAGEFWRRDYESQNGNGVSLDVKAVGVDVIKQAQNQQQGQPSGSSGQFNQQAPPPAGNQQASAFGQMSQGQDVWGGGQQQQGGPAPF